MGGFSFPHLLKCLHLLISRKHSVFTVAWLDCQHHSTTTANLTTWWASDEWAGCVHTMDTLDRGVIHVLGGMTLVRGLEWCQKEDLKYTYFWNFRLHIFRQWLTRSKTMDSDTLCKLACLPLGWPSSPPTMLQALDSYYAPQQTALGSLCLDHPVSTLKGLVPGPVSGYLQKQFLMTPDKKECTFVYFLSFSLEGTCHEDRP